MKLKNWKILHLEKIILYGVIVLAFGATWVIDRYNGDLALNLFSELLGALFVIIVVDRVLVRARRKRWTAVESEILYMIGRNVSRSRQMILDHALGFHPRIELTEKDEGAIDRIAEEQKLERVHEVLNMDQGALEEELSDELFQYEYSDLFYTQANDCWKAVDFKYNEYLDPELIEDLIGLFLYLRDLATNIRIHLKGEREAGTADYFRSIGRQGVAYDVQRLFEIMERLRQKGYQRPPERILPGDRSHPAGHKISGV